jgi:mono/diheme cytochrome c family protein
VPLYSLTTSAKIVLLIVAVTFILFSLVVAMWVPRRMPAFPGDRKLSLFLFVTAALFIAQMGAVWWATGQEAAEHEEEEIAAEIAPPENETETTQPPPAETETTPAETETAPAETQTGPTETEPAETETEPAAAGDPVAGETVFASAGCGSCHTLADAGSSGTIGPNLDDASPSADKAVERVTEGKGAMPSFADQLSEQQIADVAAYVSGATES